MTTRSTTHFATVAALSVLALTAATSGVAAAQAARRCPTCAASSERPADSPAAPSAAPARRGAPGATVPMTSASITLGAKRYAASVDAECGLDHRAVRGNGRAYYRVLYPWFGQQVAADKPQWRFTLEIRPAAPSGAYDQFVFSLQDGRTSGIIQRIAGAERMGSGSVQVTPHGPGARFDVTGTTKEGQTVRATIDCSRFEQSEAAGG